MILRAAAALQDRYLRFRYRKRRAWPSRTAYRKYRPYVLAGVLAWMLARKVAR